MRSPFKSIFLPAIVVSGAVFATITLPLSVMNAAPRWLSTWSTPSAVIAAPDKSARPIIRYVGLSIVVSVSAGIGAAEFLRRLTSRRRLAQDEASRNAVLPTVLPVDGGGEYLAVDEVETSMADEKTAIDFDQLLQAAISKGALSGDLEDAGSASEACFLDREGAAVQSEVESVPVLAFADVEQWLHLCVPNSSQGLQSQQNLSPKTFFGLRHEQRYYELRRQTLERSTAVSWAQQLLLKGEAVVVTQQGRQYTVWQALSHDVVAANPGAGSERTDEGSDLMSMMSLLAS